MMEIMKKKSVWGCHGFGDVLTKKNLKVGFGGVFFKSSFRCFFEKLPLKVAMGFFAISGRHLQDR